MSKHFTIPFLLLCAACTGPASDDSGPAAPETGETGEAGETGETGEPSEDPHATLQGRMVDTEGLPLEGLQMRVCMDSCVTAGTDSDGVFVYSRLDVGTHTMQAVSFSDEPQATPHAILTLADGDERVLEDWVLPGFVTKETLDGIATVILDGGLVLEADPASLGIGLYSSSVEPFVASVRMEPTTSGLPLDELPGPPVALWYLGNYDFQVDPAWPLSGTDALELAPGEYSLWAAHNDTKSWRPEGTLQVDADGSAILTEGGLSQLTTLVLTQEVDE
jgi:hypothetical protein